jgi:hypothetical protein
MFRPPSMANGHEIAASSRKEHREGLMTADVFSAGMRYGLGGELRLAKGKVPPRVPPNGD